MSEETSVTDQMLLIQPKEKLLFGSKKNKSATTITTTPKNGSTNDLCIYTFLLINLLKSIKIKFLDMHHQNYIVYKDS